MVTPKKTNDYCWVIICLGILVILLIPCVFTIVYANNHFYDGCPPRNTCDIIIYKDSRNYSCFGFVEIVMDGVHTGCRIPCAWPTCSDGCYCDPCTDYSNGHTLIDNETVVVGTCNIHHPEIDNYYCEKYTCQDDTMMMLWVWMFVITGIVGVMMLSVCCGSFIAVCESKEWSIKRLVSDVASATKLRVTEASSLITPSNHPIGLVVNVNDDQL